MSVETVSMGNAPGQGLSPKRVGLIVGVLSLAIFMSSLDLFIVNLAFPYIGREFHGSNLSSLSWILNGYSIMFAAVLVPAGRWADRIGRRRMFVAGLVVFTLGSVLSAVAPGVAFLIGARVFQADRRGHDGARPHCRCCSPPFPDPSGPRPSAPGPRSARSARHSVR